MLRFVLVQDVILALGKICDHCGADGQPVLDYCETNYIGELQRGQHFLPLFPNELWNMHNRS